MKESDISNSEKAQFNSMHIVAGGLCCALGYHLDAALCAIRTNMDHFQESTFYGPSRVPINVASLPDDVYGEERLQRWIMYAVLDCATRLKDNASLFDVNRTAIVLLGPGSNRFAGKQGIRLAELTHAAMWKLHCENVRPVPGVSEPTERHRLDVIMKSRAGLADGLLMAAQRLVNDNAAQVLLIGVDSYLNAADINHFLYNNRLLVKGNSDGFIPGEGAAAVVLRRAQSAAPGLHVKGVGTGDEPGRQDGSVPCRAEGLTKAIRTACTQAKISPADLRFHLDDQNGEQFYSTDSANAMTRVMFGSPKLPHLTLADKVGEIGAAAGPAMLAWMHRDMDDDSFSPGDTGLVHLANDDGLRCAVIVRHY